LTPESGESDAEDQDVNEEDRMPSSSSIQLQEEGKKLDKMDGRCAI
jgi:hypothetical protein